MCSTRRNWREFDANDFDEISVDCFSTPSAAQHREAVEEAYERGERQCTTADLCLSELWLAWSSTGKAGLTQNEDITGERRTGAAHCCD